MATDFSTRVTDVDTKIEPAAQLVQPVTRQGELDGLETIGKGLITGAKVVATSMRNKAEGDKNKALADFSIRLIEIDSAMEQGLSPSEGTVRKQALLSQTLASMPNLEQDVLARYSTNRTQSGFSDIDTDAQQRVKMRQAQITAAVDSGFISSNDVGNSSKEEAAIADLEKFQRSVRELEDDTKRLNNASSRLDLTDKQRKTLKEAETEKVMSSLARVGADSLPYWNARYTEVKEAANKATNEQERQKIIRDGILSMQQDFAQRTAAMSGDVLSVGNEKVQQIIQPSKDLLDTYVKELSGEYDTGMFEARTKNAKARAEALVVQNLTPEAHQWIAMSNLSKSMGDVLGAQLAEVAVQYAKNLQSSSSLASTEASGGTIPSKPADPLPSGGSESKGVRKYFDTLTSVIGKANSGTLDEPTKKEIDQQLTSVLRGIDIYSNSTESAEEFQPVIDFLSNPEVGKYMQGNTVPEQFKARAAQVIQDGYGSYVVPMLKDELGKMYARSMKDVAPSAAGDITFKVGDIVEPTIETGRFGFKLKAGVDPNMTNKAAVNVLNNSAFSKVLNKMVISNAHINGNTDYKASFEQLAPTIFDQQPAADSEAPKKISFTPTADQTAQQDFNLNDLVETPNEDVIQEVLDARDQQDGMSTDEINVSRARGYTPDIENLKPDIKDNLVALQNTFGKPLPVVSGYRDANRNAKAGGAKRSQHIHGNAIDLDVSDLGRSERVKLIKLARAQGFKGVGVYANSIHLDMGGTRAWGPSHHKESIPQWALTAFNDE